MTRRSHLRFVDRTGDVRPDELSAPLDGLFMESMPDDARDGWLIFAVPPAEVAIHRGKAGRHELHLMCNALDETLSELRAKGLRRR